MKKHLLSIACIATLILSILSSCGNNNTATIKGEIKNADGRKLYIEELNISVRKLIDTAKLDAKGDFSFKYKFTKDEPSFVILRTDSLTLATLLIEKGENLNYSGDFKRPMNYTLTGSEGSVLVKNLNDQLAVTGSKLDSLARLMQKAENDSVSMQINYAMGAVVVKHKQALIRFIISHPTSYASFTAIYQRLPGGIGFFGKDNDILYYKTLVDSLSARYPQSVYVQVLRDDYKQIENAINVQSMLDNVEMNEGIPEIELENQNGSMVKLSSLKGKTILIDFWSAANPRLLMNNRELIDIYAKYNSRGFEVYQVSEDDNREAWLQAINNQQIKWLSVMDTPSSYAARIYNVTKIPSNYLIDASGEVIGKDLYGDDLDKKLNDILARK